MTKPLSFFQSMWFFPEATISTRFSAKAQKKKLPFSTETNERLSLTGLIKHVEIYIL